IREIEFIVQSLQLVRGGTIVELQDRQLLSVLPKLVSHSCLPEKVAAELRDAYWFLRRFENRLQAIADRQTHDVPGDEVSRARLALAMDCRDWGELEVRLDHHRNLVREHFENIVFRGADEPETDTSQSAINRAWSEDADTDVIRAILDEMGFAESGTVAKRLTGFRDGGGYRRMDEAGRQRLDTLMPALVQSAAEQVHPDQALTHTLAVIETIGRRSAYFALLNENPMALERLVGLCSMSEFLARQVAAHPLLLDELLDQRVFLAPPTREDMQADLASRISRAAPDDPEQGLDALRNFQQAATFRVAVADLSGTLPLMKVSDRLTDIAELVLQASIDLTWPDLTRQFGAPRCRDEDGERDARFAIVAYGKLGGLELGYGSDLDLVFLNDSEGEAQHTDGDRSLENPVFFARLTRRLIHILTMPTPSGRLYEVDTRLRP
ncbi:MAG: hypothetical protein MI702_08290, partial [Chlorobiales bacterium]|nr:hypothetical protein [Chlorobiales bacterium]